MSLLVVGSMAFDSISTPHGSREEILGGAATFFSVASRNFVPVGLVAVVGEDFPEEHLTMLRGREIDLAGLERRQGGRTFRWSGSYEGRMDCAKTLDTQLNVLGEFRPTLPEAYRKIPYVFLANGDPITQVHVIEQLEESSFVMLDTMNFWIDDHRENLMNAIRKVDGLIMNDEEALSLGGSTILIRAMLNISQLGVRTLIVKKGEHGAILLKDGELFALPAYPLEVVKDPTGAGDTFAAGVMGYLAESGSLDFATFKKALAYGTVVASYTVEDFGLDSLLRLTRSDIDRRFEALLDFTTF